MSIKWNTLPASTAVAFYRAQLSRMISPGTYGFGEDQWTLTEILIQSDAHRIPAMQLITGDEPNGRQRPDRAFMTNGIPMMFKLKVLSRNACYKDSNGALICASEDENAHFYGKRLVVKSHEEKPVAGDIIRWKDRMRDPDTLIMADGLPTEFITPMMIEPNISVSHLQAWEANGEDSYIYGTFTVDEAGCILCPVKYAQPMLKTKGFRVGPRFRKMTKVRPGEKPQRRITNWWFEEVPMDYGKEQKIDDNQTKSQSTKGR